MSVVRIYTKFEWRREVRVMSTVLNSERESKKRGGIHSLWFKRGKGVREGTLFCFLSFGEIQRGSGFV